MKRIGLAIIATLLLLACGHKTTPAVSIDASVPAPVVSQVTPPPVPDASVSTYCNAWGIPGECISKEACTTGRSPYPYPGFCANFPGTACCMATPDLADNPPPPRGWKLLQQAHVTSEMTAWAISVRIDVDTYPMYVTTTKQFGSLLVLAKLEWHPPDFNKEIVHRGVTLFEKD